MAHFVKTIIVGGVAALLSAAAAQGQLRERLGQAVSTSRDPVSEPAMRPPRRAIELREQAALGRSGVASSAFALDAIVGIGIDRDDVVYAWRANGEASAGSSQQLQRVRTSYSFESPPNRRATEIVAAAIACSNNRIYTWFEDGRVSVGVSDHLDELSGPTLSSLPPGKTGSDIVGAAIAGSDRVYAWYRDGTASSGTTDDLDRYRAPYLYTLPPGKTPADILGVAIACSSDRTYTWYRDGTVSVGTTDDLDRHQTPDVYTGNATPAFQLPFTCGQTWRASTYDGHFPDQDSLDLSRYDGGANISAGEDVLASAAGEVIEAHDTNTESPPYGSVVTILHDDDWMSQYIHLDDDLSVGLGDRVFRGQKIGEVGTMLFGRENAHLHYTQWIRERGVRASFNGVFTVVNAGARNPDGVYPTEDLVSANCGR